MANLGEHRGSSAGLADLAVVVVVVVVVPAHESLKPEPASLLVEEGRARLSLI